MILALIAFVVSLICCQAVDLTLVAQETGPDVVDAVVDQISLSCVFGNDKLMLRRMAQAETNDGATLVTAANYDGGIWKVSLPLHE